MILINMNLDQLYPYGFRKTLFDRLLPTTEQDRLGMSLQELRESVATDLEDLLKVVWPILMIQLMLFRW